MAEKNVKFYKTKDGTVVLCKDEVARQGVEELQGIYDAIENLPDGQHVSAQVAIHTTEIAALQSGKANINGSYDSMTVGMAKNVEATSEVSGTSLYRPTAGNADVADGVARTLKIGGNATQWDQLIPNREEKLQNKYFGPIHNGTFPCVKGHKYYIKIYAKSDVTNDISFLIGTSSAFGSSTCIVTSPTTDYKAYSFIREFNGTTGNNCALKLSSAYSGTALFKDCQVIDLTLMFGAGNEPSSPEVFEAWLQNNIGLQTYYPYNAGKLLAAKLLGLRTVWLNQWDEEWEVGAYSSGGEKMVYNQSIRSKNAIPVLPNTSYYINIGTMNGLFCYNAEGVMVQRIQFSSAGTFTTPSSCVEIRFDVTTAYGTTYNHDICINLHYTNGRDGEYEPYVEHNYNFDTSKVYGKLNGEGNYVQIFTDGMRSAGSARDELTINGGAAKVVKRVGSVDLGSLTYSWRGDGTISCDNIVDYKLALNVPALCSSYQYRGTIQGIAQMSTGDKQIALFYNGDGTTRFLYIRDTSLSSSDVSQQGVVSKFSGFLLFYELAEPSEYTDLVYRDNGVDTPIDALNIQVSNYGTEEQIVESPTNGEPNSCAATLDILYGVNAADFMDAANNGAFVSKASLDALCNTLGSTLGGTLTSTWNSTEGHYDFTFTPATNQIENPENNE